MRGNGSVEVPLHFPEEPDSNIDDLAAIDVFNMLEEVRIMIHVVVHVPPTNVLGTSDGFTFCNAGCTSI